MTATHIQTHASTVSTGSSKQITGIGLQAGDVIVIAATTYDNAGADVFTSAPTGGSGLSWTTRQTVAVSGRCSLKIWTAEVGSTQTASITVSTTASGHVWSWTADVWRAHDGVGVSTSGETASGTPQFTLGSVAASSAVFQVNADWNATSGTRTPVTSSAGSFTEDTYHSGTSYVRYNGRYPNAGVAGSKSIGWSAPTGQRPTWGAIEIRGPGIQDRSGSDTATVAVGDTAALAVPLRARSGADTATVAAADSAALVREVPRDGTDSVAVAVTDTAFVGTPVERAGSDTAAVAATETTQRATVGRTVTTGDTATVTASETAAAQVALRNVTTTDTATVALTDTGQRNSLAPTTGTRTSPPLALPAGPVAGSTIFWAADPGGGTILVETSVDNGATWQTASNGDPVPRLPAGSTTARTVITRITLTRPTANDPSPRVHRLEVQVSVDATRNELAPVGVFTLNDTEVSDGAGGQEIELSGADLSRRVSRNRWEDTYVVVEGTNYATAIEQLITDRLPGTVFNFASTSRTTPRLFFGEQSSNDPWQDAQDMAVAIGHELFFDARGICTLRPEPDPETDAAVWEFDDRAAPTVTGLVRRVSDENTYNKVVASGEGSGNDVPVRAVAVDDDPASPTYFLGPYGTVTLFVRSPMILTAEQAQDAADALLRRVKGATEAVEVTAVPMPALEPGDVVGVTRGKVRVQGRFLIEQLRIPLGADEAMRAVGRRQRQ